ncbi:atherin-like isoform X1 [Canis lupus familiaris]|uniref:atherin-like isoform X1 n=1 Tax=Canis lupus familiaris TaxID=9615 RepID=UPI0018F62440|nr:atherin-like isoform X1 [Canis lupus familiaris]
MHTELVIRRGEGRLHPGRPSPDPGGPVSSPRTPPPPPTQRRGLPLAAQLLPPSSHRRAAAQLRAAPKSERGLRAGPPLAPRPRGQARLTLREAPHTPHLGPQPPQLPRMSPARNHQPSTPPGRGSFKLQADLRTCGERHARFLIRYLGNGLTLSSGKMLRRWPAAQDREGLVRASCTASSADLSSRREVPGGCGRRLELGILVMRSPNPCLGDGGSKGATLVHPISALGGLLQMSGTAPGRGLSSDGGRGVWVLTGEEGEKDNKCWGASSSMQGKSQQSMLRW